MTSVLPQLGGPWHSNPDDIIGLGLAHAMTSRYSQSTIYAGEVISIAHLVALHQNNPTSMTKAIEDGLTKYFSRFFSSVTVTAVTKDKKDNGDYTLSTTVEVIYKGEPFSKTEIADVAGGSLVATLNEVNL